MPTRAAEPSEAPALAESCLLSPSANLTHIFLPFKMNNIHNLSHSKWAEQAPSHVCQPGEVARRRLAINTVDQVHVDSVFLKTEGLSSFSLPYSVSSQDFRTAATKGQIFYRDELGRRMR